MVKLNQTGGINFKVIFWLVVLFAVVHIGIKLVPMYMSAEQMKDDMTMKSRLAQALKDDEIRSELVKKAKSLDLPLDRENFILERDEESKRMKISTKWDIELNFFWGTYYKTYHFEPLIDESYSTRF